MRKKIKRARCWCAPLIPLIPALGRKRQVDLCEFETSLVYRASSRTAGTVTQRNPVSNKNKNKKQKKEEKV